MTQNTTPPRNPPFMTNPAEATEVARLRDIVVKKMGDSPWEVSGVKADDEGELQVTFRAKTPKKP